MPPKRKRGKRSSGPSKKKTTKVLSTAKKATVKAKVKGPIIARAQRLKRQGSEQAFGDLYREQEPDCKSFGDKRRGCKTASVTLYPRAGVEVNQDSDAIGTL